MAYTLSLLSVDVGAVEESVWFGGSELRAIVDGLREHASVETVYGDAIEAHGRTIIPAARVAYGFGGGFGSGPEAGGEEDRVGGTGGGGGGGVVARPVGALEVTQGATRFVRFGDRRRLVAAAAVGLVLGLLFGRR